MYIGSSQLKIKAKKTLKGGYFSCLLAALVMGFATGTGSVGPVSTYKVDTSRVEPGSFHSYIQSYGPAEWLTRLDIPVYMIGTFLSVMAIVLLLAILISIFLLQPLEVGCRKFFIQASKGDYNLGYMGEVFSPSYMNVVKIMLLRWIYIFLWSLLFIIPGIVKSYEYRMIPYILAEDPSMPTKEVFRKSRTMMMGDKMNAFLFDLSFILWFLLSSLTLGIAGVLFVDPYYANSCTELYVVLKTKVKEPAYQQAGVDRVNAVPYPVQTAQPSVPVYDVPPAFSQNGTTLPEKTVSAEDAKPFDTPYGQ